MEFDIQLKKYWRKKLKKKHMLKKQSVESLESRLIFQTCNSWNPRPRLNQEAHFQPI